MRVDCRRAGAGFTLIELVVVLTIIAILAAVALPRLIDVQKDARVAKANAMYGSLRSAIAMAKSRCELDIAGNLTGAYVCTPTGGHVNMEGVAVTMVNRYPTADAQGVQAAAAINPAVDGLSVANPGGPGPAATMVFTVVGAANAATCRIAYTASAAAGAPPALDIDTSGC